MHYHLLATMFLWKEKIHQTANWCIKKSPKLRSFAAINVQIKNINYTLHCTFFKVHL